MPKKIPSGAAARSPLRPETLERVYGLAAALAVLKQRPEDVVRIAHTRSLRQELGDVLREAARRRIAYRELEETELARVAGAIHHEGICLLVRGRAATTVEELARRCEPRGLLLALDAVANPHNTGAVLRSAAFFGARGLLVGDPHRSTLTPAAVRIAQGGAEHVPVLLASDLPKTLDALRALGVVPVGAENRATGTELDAFRWPARCVLCLGKEDAGLSAPVRKRCEAMVRIPGSGLLESLNVSVAAGVLLASYATSERSDGRRR